VVGSEWEGGALGIAGCFDARVVVEERRGVKAYTHYRKQGEYFLVDSLALTKRD